MGMPGSFGILACQQQVVRLHDPVDPLVVDRRQVLEAQLPVQDRPDPAVTISRARPDQGGDQRHPVRGSFGPMAFAAHRLALYDGADAAWLCLRAVRSGSNTQHQGFPPPLSLEISRQRRPREQGLFS